MNAAAQTAFTDAFVGGLASGGVRDLVVSPGSRSTALLLAARRAGLRLHPIHDERAAGFFALGLARTTGAPPALLCTSGTAAAHYLPAIMEASATGLGLIVLGADRPPELHGSGANQTIDQSHLFGRHVRAYLDLGLADGSDATLRAAARRGAQAVVAARWPDPGPVHVNAPARKPLEPAAHSASIPRAPAIDLPRVVADRDALESVANWLSEGERPALIAGPAHPGLRDSRDAVLRLATALDAPLLADATSQLPSSIPAHDLAAGLLDADRILQIGRPPIGSRIERWLAERPRVVLAERGHPDPGSTAERFVFGALDESLRALAEHTPSRSRPGWSERWRGLADTVERTREALLADGFHEGHVARIALDRLPEAALLVLGNSLPVRHADLWARPTNVPVLHQRGVSGIDGLIAGAAGANVGASAPTLAMIGDVSFLHDVGGLSAARRCERPLVILVVDNGGGRIFEWLPVHGAIDDADFEALFAMAPAIDVEAAAKTFGHRYVAPRSPDSLASALDAALTHEGCTVVHAVASGGRVADSALADAILEAAR
ncbi:MAG: 2-succinyl-5-enolpyruvyl-6-hydroxy-3-cyclohexene-1-carboxylic-acid synthase [Deltaproteobacteria bacterium]|nr:2-succinyl-5-enolpyruvyl-6-hydroxy-3-cyclohexene-1-carboxylic-acid synthase [Deltaproteobacteria bacterium]